MQYAIQDIRGWGNKKLYSYFFPNKHIQNAFLERLRIRNMMLSDVKCSAYSLPKVYNKLSKSINQNYKGMQRFMDMCEPLMSSLDNPDSTVQRKFRNQWDTLWKCFMKDTGLNEEAVTMIKELGIRICFYDSTELLCNTAVSQELSDRFPSDVFDFYNTVLSWYVFSLAESNIRELGLTPLEMIETMIMY